MTMRISLEDFLGVEEAPEKSAEEIASTMALNFEAAVFGRLKELGLKQKDLAARLGVSPATVSKTLSSNSNITFRTAARIAAALGCSVQSPILLPSLSTVEGASAAWQLSSGASETSRSEIYLRESSDFAANLDEDYRRLCRQSVPGKSIKSKASAAVQPAVLLGDAA